MGWACIDRQLSWPSLCLLFRARDHGLQVTACKRRPGALRYRLAPPRSRRHRVSGGPGRSPVAGIWPGPPVGYAMPPSHLLRDGDWRPSNAPTAGPVEQTSVSQRFPTFQRASTRPPASCVRLRTGHSRAAFENPFCCVKELILTHARQYIPCAPPRTLNKRPNLPARPSRAEG